MLKKILFTVFFASISAMLKGQSIQTDSTTHKSSATSFSFVNSLLDFADEHLHFRYRSGGTSTKGFDCSGFVRYCFKNFGMVLPHGSAAQSLLGNTVARTEALPGDLIFFKGHNSKQSRVGHVGIVTEVTDKYVKFIHSAWNGGIRYDYLESDYYRKRFVSIKRVFSTHESSKDKKD